VQLRFFVHHRHIVLDGTGKFDVSVVVNLHTVESYRISSSMNTTKLFSSFISSNLIVFLLHHQSFFDVKKNFCMATYTNLATVWVSVSSLYPNVVLTYGLYVWVSILTMRSRKTGSPVIFKISFRTMKPNDFTNTTLDAVSFFPGIFFPVKDDDLSSASAVHSTQTSHVTAAI